jgi:predicted esterase
MFLRLPLIFSFIFISTLAFAQQTAQKFIQETDYLLYLPPQYHSDTAQRWPLMIFLHGSGESGHDLQKVKAHGPPELVEKGKVFPFIIVSPQSDVPNGWDADMLYKLLQDVKRKYRTDNDRIYLTGLSMGGYGTWALAMKHPEEFAAIAPVCGGGDTTDAWKLRNIPIWCFHGAKDNVVLPVYSENLVRASRRLNHDVKFTLYPEANHNSWDLTYNNDSLYAWMLSHTKFHYQEVPVKASVLKTYAGRYVGGFDRDTVMMEVTNNGLVAKPGNEIVPLKAASDHLFFLDADKPMDIRFTKTGNRVNGFIFYGDRKEAYRKL